MWRTDGRMVIQTIDDGVLEKKVMFRSSVDRTWWGRMGEEGERDLKKDAQLSGRRCHSCRAQGKMMPLVLGMLNLRNLGDTPVGCHVGT